MSTLLLDTRPLEDPGTRKPTESTVARFLRCHGFLLVLLNGVPSLLRHGCGHLERPTAPTAARATAPNAAIPIPPMALNVDSSSISSSGLNWSAFVLFLSVQRPLVATLDTPVVHEAPRPPRHKATKRAGENIACLPKCRW